MVIRKKDGNVYVLEGPNPMVDNQQHWDPNGLVFHNFSWDEIIYSRTPSKSRHTTSVAVEEPPRKERIEPAQEIIEPRQEEVEIPAVESPAPTEREFDLPYIKYKVLCYCLPAETKVHVDKLYGESWQRVSYGKKFVFPCVVVESGDLSFEFWTSDPNNKVLERSIVYPFSYEVHNLSTDSYDRVPYDEYRWWKVSDRESKEGGWLFRCVPSETQPDFSD